MIDQPDTIVTYSKDRQWQPVGPLDENGKGIFVSLMYGDLETQGPTAFLMKYSAGITAPPHVHGHDYYAVVVSGRFRHYLHDQDEYEVLTPGSTWFQKGNAVHGDTCLGDEDCVLSIFWPHGFDVTSSRMQRHNSPRRRVVAERGDPPAILPNVLIGSRFRPRSVERRSARR